MLTRRPWGLLVAAALAVVRPAAPAAAPPAPSSNVAGPDLPIVKVHRYRMSGHIRPLLFWISRDDVGDGRLVWRQGADGAAGWDFVLGTDPERAAPPEPLGLHHRGEAVAGACSQMSRRGGLLGGSTTTPTSGATGGEFKAVRGRVTDGAVEAWVSRVQTPRVMAIGDVDELVVQAQAHLEKTKLTTLEPEDDVRPGFLVAVAERVAANVNAHRAGAAGPASGRCDPYASATAYASPRRPAARRRAATLRRYANVVKAKFRFARARRATGPTSSWLRPRRRAGGVPSHQLPARWWLRWRCTRRQPAGDRRLGQRRADRRSSAGLVASREP
jgi:hypothetical protein